MEECQYRGQEIRLVDCPSCRGNVQMRVFACSKHGECTIGKQIPGVHICDGHIPPPPVKPVIESAPVTMHDNYPLCGVLQSSLQATDGQAHVKLDDGRIVVAENLNRRQGFVQKRCVVRANGTQWVLLQ